MAATRARILEACASVMETGADLTYSNVAEAAGVQQRTVYRHFPTKADLEAGLWGWIIDHLTHADFAARSEEELVVAMRTSFVGFDTGAPLIQAMLHSRQGLEIRLRQQAMRRVMFEACIEGTVPEAPALIRTRAAAALQVLYSAASWEFLRSFGGWTPLRPPTPSSLLSEHCLLGCVRARGNRIIHHCGLKMEIATRTLVLFPQREGTREDLKGENHERNTSDHN